MVMKFPGTPSHNPFEWPYKFNLVRTGITDVSIWSSRDGVEVEKTYP